MRYYSYGGRSGRLIGKAGDLTIYARTYNYDDIEHENEKRTDFSFNFSYGPLTGGIPEPFRFDINTSGEKINYIKYYNYKIRNIKLKGINIKDAIPYIERINGNFAASYTICFLSSVMDALEIEIPYELKMYYIIEMELERIRNHLYVLARMCEPAGFNVPANMLMHIKERFSRIIDITFGHRYFFGVNQLKSKRLDIHKMINVYKNEINDIYLNLLNSRLFTDRLQDNGRILDDDMTGPAARAAGYKYDSRYDFDIFYYNDTGYEIKTDDSGDAMSRFNVRFNEILNSIDIIENAENKTGDSCYNILDGSGTGLTRVESPSGDVAFYVELSNGVIKDLKIHTALERNMKSFLKSSTGTIFTDFHFNFESFGLWAADEVNII
ncbi:formate hydrogenlyase subunit 5 [Picrophilus oshimae]|uniref:Formate hydrogenlyase subunit 5 n=1 Tax=Picrophilus torridus (strain ATCC 700027 / DSM 9790 / JCM 10055 / NBRC 100828 / KAW 2/3) TaxID=1122961 RepID=Q6L0U1_PICTO|nr:formate hydrogenlyase subunit 5 [Picrophilus oshimae]AAT43411.1 formate hydrogenlyase subunit 5 [Picrophilus oshimae DSM 9789]